MNTQEKEAPIKALRTEQAVKSPLILSMLVFSPAPLLGNQAVRPSKLSSAQIRMAAGVWLSTQHTAHASVSWEAVCLRDLYS